MKLLLLVVASACTQQTFTTTQASSLELELEASPFDVDGRFAASTGTVRFTGHADPGSSATATLAVGDTTIDVSYDARVGSGTVSFEIAGVLGERDREALGELAVALDRAFPYTGDPDQASGALLRTYAGYLSEWTLGATKPRTVMIGKPISSDPKDPGDGIPPGTPPKHPPPPGDPPPLACGNTPDDDGIALLQQCCNGGQQVLWQHDALDHCFTTNANRCGFDSRASNDPLATDCPGRCGPGCTSLPLYTQDCLDHDLCLMHHQGLGSVDPTGSCGDEMLDAIDDVAFVYASGVGWFVSTINGCNY